MSLGSNGATATNGRHRPPLKWAGGKRWLVSQLEPIWAKHAQRRYVEPFCGGLAAVLGLEPGKAILNDANPHLINFYKHLQKGLTVEIEMQNDEKLFYSHRQRFNELILAGKGKTSEAAQLFYYLNRTCFNGLCRFNQSGEFNVPFGSFKRIKYAPNFLSYRDLFRSWSFSSGDFRSLELREDDFIYADPPYDVEFTTYSAGGFSWQDQERAAHWLAAHPGPVVISNQKTDRIVELYRDLGFNIQYLDGPRRISCTGDRSSAKEVLATKHL